MANAAEGSSSDWISDKDSSDENADSKADCDLSTENRESLLDPKLAASTSYNGKKKQNATAKQKWKRRFRYLSYRHFLRHTMEINDTQTGGGLSPREKKKREVESDGFYADDKGYLQGLIYDQLENGEEIGFTGDVSRKLNLMPPVIGEDITSEDAELSRTDFKPDSDTPEIIVVPCSKFVREISSGN